VHVTIQISDGSGTSITASVPETLSTQTGPGSDDAAVRSGLTTGPAINAGPAPTGSGGQEPSSPGDADGMVDSDSTVRGQSAGPAPSFVEG
jgi:hypothetical protein